MQAYIEAIREAWIVIQLSRTDWAWQLADPTTPLQTLAADGDLPFIDAEYHVAIVWHALRSRSLSQVTTELRMLADEKWATYHALLVRRYVTEPLSFRAGGCEW